MFVAPQNFLKFSTSTNKKAKRKRTTAAVQYIVGKYREPEGWCT